MTRRDRFALLIAALLTALLTASLTSCQALQRGDQTPAIGTAYAGPASLALHKDLDIRSAVVATVHHGDRLDIIGQRRRLYKVRSARGIEGWTMDRDLLDPGQMKRLKALAAETAGMPSQGVATVFNPVNVHTEPARQSPSFIQVQPNEKFNIIIRKVTGRVPLPKRQLVPAKPKVVVKKKEKAPRVPLPAAPVAPAPPVDWRQLSQERQPTADEPAEDYGGHPIPQDDWTLIRTKNGQSGWVLTSSLYLAIPDEVAQYAEGHRITSYFSIGKIKDGDQEKDIWLWTTAEKLDEPWDFDGYRVFTWSTRRHRYETAYIQRREEGYFPVIASIGEFSVCLMANDGSRVRRKYVMMGNAVRPAGMEPCMAPEAAADNPAQQLPDAQRAGVKTGTLVSWESRVKKWFGR